MNRRRMYPILLWIISFVLTLGTTGFSYNEAHFAKIQEGVDAWNTWIQNKMHTIQTLSNTYTYYADLSGANLKGLDLSGAWLFYTNLANADLSDCILVKANLQSANLTQANLSGANLSQAQLTSASLKGAALNRANFKEANLIHANLESAQGENTDFTQSNLYDANLTNMVITNAIISSTNLMASLVYNVDFSAAQFIVEGVNLNTKKKETIPPSCFMYAKANQQTKFPPDFDVYREKIRFVTTK